MDERKITQELVAERLGKSQGTVSHWLSNSERRKVNLVDFFDLCKAAEADPAEVLFGMPSEERRQAIVSTIRGLLEATDPGTSKNHYLMEKPARPERRHATKKRDAGNDD